MGAVLWGSVLWGKAFGGIFLGGGPVFEGVSQYAEKRGMGEKECARPCGGLWGL